MKDLEETIASTVKLAIEAQTKAALIEALGGTDKMMDHLIRQICNRKVKVDYREVPLLDHLLTKAVDEAIKQIALDLIAENQGQIKAAVVKKIKADASSVAEALVNQVLPSQVYYFKIEGHNRD